jgi:hypothetical protein
MVRVVVIIEPQQIGRISMLLKMMLGVSPTNLPRWSEKADIVKVV